MKAPDLSRETPYQDDLLWMPPSMREERVRSQRRAYVAAAAALVVWAALMAFAGFPRLLVKLTSPIPGLAVAAALAGQLFRSNERQKALALATGVAGVDGLKAQKLVHVRGRVRALPGGADLASPGAVLRRMVIAPTTERRVIYELGTDFDLIDGSGRAVRIRVSNARLVVQESLALVRSLEWPPQGPVGDVWQDDVVRDGDEVHVIGCPEWELDAKVERLERQEASAPALRDGGGLPLIVAPVDKPPPADNWPLSSS